MRVYALQQLVVNMLYVMYDKLLTSMNKQDVDPPTIDGNPALVYSGCILISIILVCVSKLIISYSDFLKKNFLSF